MMELEITELQYKELRDWKYQTACNYAIRIPIKPKRDIHTALVDLDQFGNLTIRSGYAWDGASGPTFDTRKTIIPSLIHDAIYQLIRMGVLPESDRRKADLILKEAMLACGIAKWRYTLWYWGVWFAGGAARKGRKYDPQSLILRAP